MIAIDRRAALRALGGALVMAATSVRPAIAHGRQDELLPWLEGQLGNLDWSVLGPAARAVHADEATTALVGAVLAGRRSGEAIDQLLERKIREDFEADRIVDLAGWRVALTESRLIRLLVS
ncbi:MAG: hypothetical protein ACKVZ0_22925 [Gemmatimonadales bacterium]